MTPCGEDNACLAGQVVARNDQAAERQSSLLLLTLPQEIIDIILRLLMIGAPEAIFLDSIDQPPWQPLSHGLGIVGTCRQLRHRFLGLFLENRTFEFAPGHMGSFPPIGSWMQRYLGEGPTTSETVPHGFHIVFPMFLDYESEEQYKESSESLDEDYELPAGTMILMRYMSEEAW